MAPTFCAGAGADSLQGGLGSDTADYTGSTAVVVDLAAGSASGGDADGDSLDDIENVTGTVGDDTLRGDVQANRLVGAAGADILVGRDGDDTLEGGDGDDTVQGGAGADDLQGGDGLDTADYTGSDTGVDVDLGTGTGLGGDAAGDSYSSIENVTGSGQIDTLTGDGGSNVLFGAGGDDVLEGAGGADTLQGGTGEDAADYSNSTNAVTVDLSGGPGVGGDAEGDTFDSIENLIGSANGDTLTGDGADNTINAGLGDDTVRGLGGDDQLFGEAGDDTLEGGQGNDLLNGGDGTGDTASYLNSSASVEVNLGTGQLRRRRSRRHAGRYRECRWVGTKRYVDRLQRRQRSARPRRH